MNPYFDDKATVRAAVGSGIRRPIAGLVPLPTSERGLFDEGAIGTPHAHDVHEPESLA